MSDFSKGVLKVVLAILFFPVTLTILVFKSDMSGKSKLITTLLIWGITIGLGSISPSFLDSKESQKTISSDRNIGNTVDVKASKNDQEDRQMKKTAMTESADTDIDSKMVEGIDYPFPESDVKKGSSSEDIMWIQTALNLVAGFNLSVDGDYGKMTESAVKRFQETYDLETSGVADEETLDVLRNVLSGNREAVPIPSNPTATPTPSPAPVNTYVINMNTGKFHRPSCRDVSRMNESNKWYFEGTIDEVYDMGYNPCGHCNPW